jgi:hypothetical protein
MRRSIRLCFVFDEWSAHSRVPTTFQLLRIVPPSTSLADLAMGSDADAHRTDRAFGAQPLGMSIEVARAPCGPPAPGSP